MKAVRYVQRESAPVVRLEPPGFMNIDDHVVAAANKIANFIDINPNNEGFWNRAGLIVSLGGMVLGTFICFARGDFIDLIVPFVAFFYLLYRGFTEFVSLRTLAWVVFASIVLFDLPWIWVYTGSWAGKDITDSGI